MQQYFHYTAIGGLMLCMSVLFHPDAKGGSESALLSVSVSGLGTLVSEPPGISCPGSCEAEFPAFSDVELRAKPYKGERFLGWEGDCDSPTKSCRLYMDGVKIVQANFSVSL